MTDLPYGIKASDLTYPKRPRGWDWKKPHATDTLHHFTLHHTERFGWVIATLHIRNAGRRHRSDAQDRTYAVNTDGNVVRVGLGPHITKTITVHVTRGREKALQGLIDNYNKGLAAAGDVRDRISTRRAQGALRRSRNDWSF